MQELDRIFSNIAGLFLAVAVYVIVIAVIAAVL